MKQLLKDYCASLDIDQVGIAPIGPYTELAGLLQERIERGHSIEFDELSVEKRTNPQLLLPDSQSIIVCLFPYYTGSCPKANLSTYTYGYDYHQIIKEKLTSIGDYLQSQLPDFRYQAYTDTGPLADRYLAWLAGLGFYGINTCLIHDTYGSWFFIGYLVTNHPFAPDTPQKRSCLQCGRCMAACPGQIILGDGTIDPRRCKSYLTQKKADLSPVEISVLQKSNLIFGCDICQDVCPHNAQVAITKLAEFRHDLVHRIDYEELVQLSNKEFRRRFGNRAFSWRGKKILVRNLEYHFL